MQGQGIFRSLVLYFFFAGTFGHAAGFPLVCRTPLSFSIESSLIPEVRIPLKKSSKRGKEGASPVGAYLNGGECAFLDRPISGSEPDRIQIPAFDNAYLTDVNPSNATVNDRLRRVGRSAFVAGTIATLLPQKDLVLTFTVSSAGGLFVHGLEGGSIAVSPYLAP
jgi:hypothetical protein